LLFLLNIFYLHSLTVCPTILPALVLRELDFFVRLDYRFNGSCPIKSFFLCGSVKIY